MKTQKFGEEQLNSLVKGKEVVTVEPVKEDEQGVQMSPQGDMFATDLNGAINLAINTVIKDNKILSKIGEIIQATNQKDDPIWFCPDCKEFAKIITHINEQRKWQCGCAGIQMHKNDTVEFMANWFKKVGCPWKLLSVQLEKIENVLVDNEMENDPKNGVYTRDWFKTWVIKK